MGSSLLRYCSIPRVFILVITLTITTIASPHQPHVALAQPFMSFFAGTGLRATDSTPEIPATVAADLARRVHRLDRLRSRLGADEGFLRAADEQTLLLLFNRTEGKNELLRAYAPSLGSDSIPSDLFENLDGAIDSLWSEITRLAPTYGSSKGHPLMKTLAQALEQRLRVSVPKATFVGGMLRENEWRVKLSALGLPESRCMTGVLFYRIPEQQWVICREFEVAQKYFKKSDASGPGEITFGCMRLQESA